MQTLSEKLSISKQAQPYFSEFLKAAEEASTLSFLPRDADLQSQTISRLKNLEDELQSFTEQMASEKRDDEANLGLSLQYACSAIRSELFMWLALKNGEWEKAWSRLIDAEESIRDSLLSHYVSQFVNGPNYERKLSALEVLVFPPQTFLSPGQIAKSLICSVCDKEYSDCEHIEGRAYAGKLCNFHPVGIEYEEISIVDVPHDKRRRVTHFGDKGGMRDKLTWKIEQVKDTESMRGHRRTEAIKS